MGSLSPCAPVNARETDIQDTGSLTEREPQMHTATLPATLDRDSLRKAVPSAFAASPWHKMSDRYRQIPTIEVVDILADRGFRPVRAGQARTRIDGKENYTRHVIRFRHDDYLKPTALGDEFPEIIMTNSHDGSSAYVFHLGLWRLACLNGLCVSSADFGGISVRHSGGSDFTDRILEASFQIVEDTPKTLETVARWKGIPLNEPQQLALASAAVELIDKPEIKPEQLLIPRRTADQKPDLWSVFNRVQESTIRGGIKTRNERGRRSTTRAVKSVTRDLALNKALWRLTSEMEKLMA